MLCAGMAAVMLCPAVLAEGPATYNPFEMQVDTAEGYTEPSPAATAGSGGTVNPFEGASSGGTGFGSANANITAEELFGDNANTGTLNTAATQAPAATSNPFASDDAGGAVSTDAVNPIQPQPVATQTPSDTGSSNPFGVSTQATAAPAATATPLPNGASYNPFLSAQEAPAEALPAGTVMFVSVASTKLRTKAAENSGVISTVYFGQQLNATATQGDWAQVQSPNGKTAFCLLSDLTNSDPNTLSKTMYAQLNVTPVYKAPSQKMGRVRSLKKGDTVTMLAITSDGLWARVTDGTNYGFVPSIYLDDALPAEGTPVWCQAGSTAVMVNPENWIQISTLSLGQQCWLVGYASDNAIAKIRSAKGYVAYCDASALATADPATGNTPVYAQCTGKILATNTGSNARTININKNVQMMLLGVDQSQRWALVRARGRKLYVPYIYIGTERLGNNTRTVAVNQDVPLYNSANNDSGVLGTLPMGTRVSLVGGDLSFARVSVTSGGLQQPITGYVPLEYLTGV